MIDSTAYRRVTGSGSGRWNAKKDFEDMAGKYERGQIRKLVIGPNARPGMGYRPHEGFAVAFDPDAPFKPEDFNTSELFRGVATGILMHNTDIMEYKNVKNPTTESDNVTGWSVLKALKEAVEEALEEVHDNKSYLSLKTNPSAEPTVFVWLDATSGTYYMGIECHMDVDPQELGEDIPDVAFLIDKTVNEAKTPYSVQRAFLKDSPLGKIMKSYYQSQKFFRERCLKHMRKHLWYLYLEGADESTRARIEKYVTSRDVRHSVTNTANMSADGKELIYYSQMTEGVLDDGSLIDAGPFDWSVYVQGRTSNGQLEEADKLNAVPYQMPFSITAVEAIKQVVMERFGETDGATIAPVAKVHKPKEKISDSPYTHVYSVIEEPSFDGAADAVAIALQHGDKMMGDYVWYNKKVDDEKYMRTVSPFEHLKFVRGINDRSVRASLSEMGIEVDGGVVSLLVPAYRATLMLPFELSAGYILSEYK